jgi:hypothetical protein
LGFFQLSTRAFHWLSVINLTGEILVTKYSGKGTKYFRLSLYRRNSCHQKKLIKNITCTELFETDKHMNNGKENFHKHKQLCASNVFDQFLLVFNTRKGTTDGCVTCSCKTQQILHTQNNSKATSIHKKCPQWCYISVPAMVYYITLDGTALRCARINDA